MCVMNIDMSKPIVMERDPFRGETYCVECFSARDKKFFYFYNGFGPFCNKKCFADYVGVDYNKLPSIDFRGTVK